MQQVSQVPQQLINLQKVHVYLRTFEKRAMVVKIARNVNLSELRNIVCQKVIVQDDSMVLFYKGQKLENFGDIDIALTDKSILHVVNYKNVDKKEISFFVKLVDGSKRQEFRLQSNTLIKDFVNKEFARVFGINPEKVFFVYVGKELDMGKTFFEELVQDRSEILCIQNRKKELEINQMIQTKQSVLKTEKVNSQQNVPILLQKKIDQVNPQHNVAIKVSQPGWRNVNKKDHQLKSSPQITIKDQDFVQNDLQILQERASERAQTSQIQKQPALRAAQSDRESSYNEQTTIQKKWEIFDQKVYFSESDQVHLRSPQAQSEQTQQTKSYQPPKDTIQQPSKETIQQVIASLTLRPGDMIYSAESFCGDHQTLMKEILGGYRHVLEEELDSLVKRKE